MNRLDLKSDETIEITGRNRLWFRRYLPVVLVVCVLVLYMGLWRQVWFDELLHFAMGGMTFEYAIKTIDYTTTEVNHGQTGVYLLLDWFLLQLFGASTIALRLPSLVSAAVMLASAVAFMRAKGFGWKWQSVSVIAFGANSTLMFFAGEARPYMPMAASAVAMLAYFSLPDQDRRSWWGRSLGAFGFLFGAVIHPYWILLWGLVAFYGSTLYVTTSTSNRSLKALLTFLAPRLSLSAIVLYLAVGQLTWMRRVFTFAGDPNSIYDWNVIRASFAWTHFSFVPQYMPSRSSSWPTIVSGWAVVGIAALGLLSLVFVLLRKSCRTRSLIAPLGLIVMGVASSVFLTYLSYRSAYWILERQWVAGMALTTLAVVWLYAQWWRDVRERSTLDKLPVIVYLGLLSSALLAAATTQLQLTMDRQQEWSTFINDTRTVQEFVAEPGAQTYVYDPIEGYEYMANVNVARGGPVWEEFVAWYNKWAGMRPEFRESNPGWTRFIWPDEAPQSRLCIPQLCQ